ncbi:hypothetical protein [Micromonospora sp. RTGN7]|uniref:hypothetical protein n=1 Tax=Micromonospora sp. RTGN7 TaxID=3016526 RepID=UPI0029FF1288|nr:hypothetical protein [Micromonospora sp. RTGN7]
MNPPNMGEGEPKHSLAVLIPPDSSGVADLNFVAHISEDEYMRYTSAMEIIGRLDNRNRTTLDLIERNYQHIKSLHSFYYRLFSNAREKGRVGAFDAGIAISVAVANWLMAVRLHLDHEETRIKRQYGKDSPEVQSFKSACSRAYDDSFAYRFLYKLRNFTVHCGLPLGSVNLRIPAEDERKRGIIQHIEFLLDRDLLLNGFGSWGTVKAELNAMPKNFSAVPLIDEAMPLIREIMDEIIRADITAALPHVPVALEALERTGDLNGGMAGIIQWSYMTDGGLNLTSMRWIGHESVLKLASVAAHEDPLAALRQPADPMPRHGVSPEMQYRAERGIAVLQSWLQDNGTPNFTQTLNRLIEEDGNVEPVVTGLVNTAADLLYLAALATNTTPEVILSDLSARQPHPEQPRPDGEA